MRGSFCTAKKKTNQKKKLVAESILDHRSFAKVILRKLRKLPPRMNSNSPRGLKQEFILKANPACWFSSKKYIMQQI